MKMAKKLLFPLSISLALGLSIAGLLRLGSVMFSPDMSYIRVDMGAWNRTYFAPGWDRWITSPDNSYWKYPALEGKEVIGTSGLPFETYTGCRLGGVDNGVMYRPLQAGCSGYSLLGEFSIVLNTLFWGTLCFGLWHMMRMVKSLH
jgi:hypothetical protein